ncbi:hypothetical protein SUBVAR_06833 [Subdoligranulum variabile DSM 15176]|uniref:Uncharacterized protein n=1 Tax=Subdoligranulum variabile DSM 15176 TaxID=411471 RepID=D1PR06_9FIRM|nr:hypothetical protein SUBVAR_06833 [Subdoligranulum variabile DSM 15176]
MNRNKAAVCYRLCLWQTAVFPYFTDRLPAGILKHSSCKEEKHRRYPAAPAVYKGDCEDEQGSYTFPV